MTIWPSLPTGPLPVISDLRHKHARMQRRASHCRHTLASCLHRNCPMHFRTRKANPLRIAFLFTRPSPNPRARPYAEGRNMPKSCFCAALILVPFTLNPQDPVAARTTHDAETAQSRTGYVMMRPHKLQAPATTSNLCCPTQDLESYWPHKCRKLPTTPAWQIMHTEYTP